jgi:hypothetical protein
MRKKLVTVSHLPERLPNRPTKRILLSRETIRTLTSEELSQAVGGGEECKTGSSFAVDPGV